MTAVEVITAYGALYPDRMDAATLNKYVPAAMAAVSRVTARRADSATDWKKERALQAVCAAVNELAAQDAAKSEGGARVASVSNDGYSESYGATDAEAEAQAVRRVIREWLSGTGLAGAL